MTLEEYLDRERTINGLDNILVDGVPLWRIVRTQFRWKYLESPSITINPNIKVSSLLINNLKSLLGLIKLRFGGKISNVFFPHPRLFFVNNLYIERLSDPLIDCSGIDNDYVILERHQNGEHKTPRYHQKKVYYLDIIDTLARLGGAVFRTYFKKKYHKEVELLLEKLSIGLEIEKAKYRPMFNGILSEYRLQSILMKPILNGLNPKRVFLAPRVTFYHIIDYCKKHNVKTIELEHGITVGETILYSGSYCPIIDPDYFFVFGKSNIGDQFYMPLDRVRNIGFPYKEYIKSMNLKPFSANTVLVASEPEISEKIVCALECISLSYPQCEFHIRCHPQEKMDTNLLIRLEKLSNVRIVSNSIESFCALSQYTNVMSENSSVIYEAMSLGKKVARLNFCGLKVKESDLIHGGTIINNIEDFGKFICEPYNKDRDSKDLYSDYQQETFDSIL